MKYFDIPSCLRTVKHYRMIISHHSWTLGQLPIHPPHFLKNDRLDCYRHTFLPLGLRKCKHISCTCPKPRHRFSNLQIKLLCQFYLKLFFRIYLFTTFHCCHDGLSMWSKSILSSVIVKA